MAYPSDDKEGLRDYNAAMKATVAGLRAGIQEMVKADGERRDEIKRLREGYHFIASVSYMAEYNGRPAMNVIREKAQEMAKEKTDG